MSVIADCFYRGKEKSASHPKPFFGSPQQVELGQSMELTYQLDEIERVAKKLAKLIKPGDIVGFTGELAAGKTTLISHLVAAFGYEGVVNSPTFVIEHRYPVKAKGLTEIIHLDFYRLSEADLVHFDWAEYLEAPTKIVLIEWPAVAETHLPKRMKQITIKPLDEKTRHLVLQNNPSR